jgi:hypothetical protein
MENTGSYPQTTEANIITAELQVKICQATNTAHTEITHNSPKKYSQCSDYVTG